MDTNETPKITTPFLNLRSDYGFKRAFGDPRFKGAVFKFLQAALGDEVTITAVEPHKMAYHDKEVLPAKKGDKRIVYDVYFTLNVDPQQSTFKSRHLLNNDRDKEIEHHFILEMQNVYEPPFEDRMTYYASKMVSSQGQAGWNYDLNPVILIGITNFDFPHLTRQLVQEFELREKTTSESLTKKLRLLFYSLERVPATWKECDTKLEKQLYIIKNMEKMDKNSEPYLSGEYDEIFEAAESAQLYGQEVELYSQSVSRLRSIEAGLEFRYEEGVAKGMEKGMEKGREEEREKFIFSMAAEGLNIDTIAKISDLTKEEVKVILGMK